MQPLEALSHAEAERIAYLTGDTVAALAFGQLADCADEIAELEELAEIAELATPEKTPQTHLQGLYEAALYAIAGALQAPGAIPKKRLLKLAACLIELLACPQDFEGDAMRARIYHEVGHDLR